MKSIRKTWADVPEQFRTGNPHPPGTKEYVEWFPKMHALHPRPVFISAKDANGRWFGFDSYVYGLGTFKHYLTTLGGYWFYEDETEGVTTTGEDINMLKDHLRTTTVELEKLNSKLKSVKLRAAQLLLDLDIP